MALGLDLKFDVAEAVRDVARLDHAFLESAIARDPRSGLYVLPLARDFHGESAALDAEGFGALLHVLQGIFSVIVIGCGPFSRQRPLLDMAGAPAKLFLCCNQRFASVRAAGEVLRWLADARIPTIPDLIVHQPAPGVTPTAADIGNALHLPEAIALAGNWKEMTGRFNDQKPIAMEKTAAYGAALDLCLGRAGLGGGTRERLGGRMLGWLKLPRQAAAS
jgi:Flp pilus assembly CpaE family ATPase